MQNPSENLQFVKVEHLKTTRSPNRIFRTLLLLILIVISVIIVFNNQFYNINLGTYDIAKEKVRNNSVYQFADDEFEIREFVDPNFWFMPEGKKAPATAEIDSETGRHKALLWPGETNGDRIVNQLMFVPPVNYSKSKNILSILVYRYHLNFNFTPGRAYFMGRKCPVNTCNITFDENDAPNADAIVFENKFMEMKHLRSPNQIWIMMLTESPSHKSFIWPNAKNVINWTASYRRDSDLVFPYGKWVYYDSAVKRNPQLNYNFAANKTKKVLWVVSNCHAHNKRLEIAKELGKYIQVDIYGKCGDKKCPIENCGNKKCPRNTCLRKLAKDYKFYLAFENSNCRDYITEKFFSNALMGGILPIVMGAPPEDYLRVAPNHSFIHVEHFPSLKVLSSYLHLLDSDDSLYNSYFDWKKTGTWVTNTFFCQLCALLHDDYSPKTYEDVYQWWNEDGICTKFLWRATSSRKSKWDTADWMRFLKIEKEWERKRIMAAKRRKND